LVKVHVIATISDYSRAALVMNILNGVEVQGALEAMVDRQRDPVMF
jgi:hypothetical protein